MRNEWNNRLEAIKNTLSGYERLELADYTALRRWTTVRYKDINAYVRGITNNHSELTKLESCVLQKALGKCPKVENKRLFRFETIDGSNRYVLGEEIKMNGFTATSQEVINPNKLPGLGKSLSENGKLTRIIIDNSNSGVDMSMFAVPRAQSQQEVLFPVNTIFETTGRYPDVLNLFDEVYLTEVIRLIG